MLDDAGLIADWGVEAERMFGWSSTDARGRSAHLVIEAETDLRDAIARVHAGAAVASFESRAVARDGTPRVALWTISAVPPVAGQPRRLQAVAHDITARSVAQEQSRSLEAELERSESRYRDLVESLHDVVFSVDTSGRLEYLSPAISKYGYSEADLIGRHFSVLFHPADLAALERGFSTTLAGDNDPAEYRAIDASGSIHQVQISSRAVFDGERPAGLAGVVVDVTGQRRAEEQLRVAQRLEAVGRLAGGIAHDFNNLLVVIIGYADFALESVREDDPLRRELEEICKAGERAAVLTRQLLAFSRRQVLKPEIICLNDVVRGIEGMLKRLIGEDIEFRTELGQELERVLADPGQVEQVLMNLVVNARDAMPTGGRLTIATAAGHAPPDAKGDALRHEGGWVVLSVSDTGVGMDPSTRARIFEPFFTTKPQGEGTGLGLATVYGIVSQSGGGIDVETEAGKGTVFRIILPAVTSRQGAERTAARAVAAETSGRETILVVEDEEAVRQLASRVLVSAGYKVLTAANGAEALTLCQQYTGHIDLLVSDVVMPRMSGPELAQKLRNMRLGLRVLFVSGYSGSAISHHGVLAGGTQLLEKPFTAVDLSRRVRRILDEPPDDMRSSEPVG